MLRVFVDESGLKGVLEGNLDSCEIVNDRGNAHVICTRGSKITGEWTVLYDSNASERNKSLKLATYIYVGSRDDPAKWHAAIYQLVFRQVTAAQLIYPALQRLAQKQRASGATAPGAFLSNSNSTIKPGKSPSPIAGMAVFDQVDFGNADYNKAVNGPGDWSSLPAKVKVTLGMPEASARGPAIYIVPSTSIDAARKIAYDNYWKTDTRPIAVIEDHGDIATNVQFAAYQLNCLQYLPTTKTTTDTLKDLTKGLDDLNIDDEYVEDRFRTTYV